MKGVGAHCVGFVSGVLASCLEVPVPNIPSSITWQTHPFRVIRRLLETFPASSVENPQPGDVSVLKDQVYHLVIHSDSPRVVFSTDPGSCVTETLFDSSTIRKTYSLTWVR